MTNKKFILVVLSFFAVLCAPAFAETSSAERQTVFNTVTDYVATVGKSDLDKKEILRERQDIRRETRLKAEERRKRVETRKRMKAQEEAILQKVQAQGR